MVQEVGWVATLMAVIEGNEGTRVRHTAISGTLGWFTGAGLCRQNTEGRAKDLPPFLARVVPTTVSSGDIEATETINS